MTYEVYTLTLKHCIGNGEQEHEIEEPLVIKQMLPLEHISSACILNNMMDRMKDELLSRATKGGNQP